MAFALPFGSQCSVLLNAQVEKPQMKLQQKDFQIARAICLDNQHELQDMQVSYLLQ